MRIPILVLIAACLASGCSTTGKTTGEVIDDTTLQSRVKARLVGADFTSGVSINTEVNRGVVQLGGFVDDMEAANRMAATVAEVDGVARVDKQLYLEPGERSAGQVVDDGITTTRVKSAITNANLGDGLRINVDTYNGTVLLTGFVDTTAQKQRAGAIAADDDNTKEVINGIYVY